jgi:ADP-ribosylglycohydrolase
MEHPDPDREHRVQALARDLLARQFVEAVRHRDAGFPFTPVGGGWLRLPPGAHTDDTDMALGLLSALREADYAFDELPVARNFADWVASRPPDVGASIRAVVGSPGFRADPYAASRAFYQANRNRCANGALMRNAVVAAVAPDLPTAFEWSLKQGVPTHYARLSVICCCLQAWLVFETFEGRWPFEAHADWRTAWHAAWAAWALACEDPVVTQWLDAAMDNLSTANFDPDAFDPFTHPDLPAK